MNDKIKYTIKLTENEQQIINSYGSFLIIDKSTVGIYNINNEKSKKTYIRITLDNYL